MSKNSERHELDVAEHRQVQVEDRRSGATWPPSSSGAPPCRPRRAGPSAEHPPASTGRGLVRARSGRPRGSARSSARPATRPAGEPAAGRVVAGEQQVDREHARSLWNSSRVTTSKTTERRCGSASRPRSQVGAASAAGAGSLGGRRRRTARRGSAARRSGAQEDQAGHAGGGHDQHRDLAHGVPGPDVDEGDVDDVLAAAELVRRPRGSRRHRARRAARRPPRSAIRRRPARRPRRSRRRQPVAAAGGGR